MPHVLRRVGKPAPQQRPPAHTAGGASRFHFALTTRGSRAACSSYARPLMQRFLGKLQVKVGKVAKKVGITRQEPAKKPEPPTPPPPPPQPPQ